MANKVLFSASLSQFKEKMKKPKNDLEIPPDLREIDPDTGFMKAYLQPGYINRVKRSGKKRKIDEVEEDEEEVEY